MASAGLRSRAIALELYHLSGDHLSFQWRKIIDEKSAVKVVDLVLDASGPQPAELFFPMAAIDIPPPHSHFHGALDFRELFGNRQTAFVPGFPLIGIPHDFRVEQHDRIRSRVRLLRAIHHDQALELADLRCGQSDAWRVIHRPQHVIGQTAQFGRDFVHARTGLF